MTEERPPDLLILGHVTRDWFADLARPGGAVWYGARAASLLGLRTAVVTAAPTDSALVEELSRLPGVQVHCRPSAAETTFVHDTVAGRRRLTLAARAETLEPADIPAAWRRAGTAYVGPVAGECGRALIEALSCSFIAVGLQGCLRTALPGQVVQAAVAPEAADPPGNVGAVVLSIDDHPQAVRLGVTLAGRGILVAVTRGAAGATLLTGGAQLEIPAAAAREIDPTGAGDVFGVVLALALSGGAHPRAAAAVAAEAAARVVEGPGIGTLARFDPGKLRLFPLPGGAPSPGPAAPRGSRLRAAILHDTTRTVLDLPAVDPEARTREIPAFAVPEAVRDDEHTVPVTSSIQRSLEHETLRRQSADQEDDGDEGDE